MTARYAYEYGRRWDRRVPRTDIRWFVDRLHVGTPDDDIAADIRRRATGLPGYTPAIIEASIRYALLRHARNRDLYRHVTGSLTQS